MKKLLYIIQYSQHHYRHLDSVIYTDKYISSSGSTPCNYRIHQSLYIVNLRELLIFTQH